MKEHKNRSAAIVLSLTLGLMVGCGGGATMEPPGSAAERPALSASAMSSQQAHYESVLEMLRGKVAGLEIIETQPGQIEVRIRGGNQSLQSDAAGTQQPLVVIDGMPQSRPAGEVLLSLNPQEVSSIDVLKDVSSTAVYGTRGANGVILVRLVRRD